MLQSTTLPSRIAAIATPDAPLTPAAYLRLRRRAAGLSIEQAAERLEPRAAQRAETRALIRMLETDGNTARHVSTLDYLRDAYPIDPDVYFQLMHAPADYHPAICPACGGTKWDPCDRRCALNDGGAA